MTRKIAGIATAVLLLFATMANADYEKACRATCRVYNATDNGLGTGVVIEANEQYVTVQTNAHVVGLADTVACTFYTLGHESSPLQGAVSARVRNDLVDVALVRIPTASFGGHVPPAIPVAPRGYVLKQGEEIVSIGCAQGAWPTAFRGHCDGYVGTNMVFTPRPAQGRSGSAIFDKNCEYIVGVLFAQSSDGTGENYGYACSLQALYNQLGAAKIQNPEFTLAQCYGGQCYPQEMQQGRGYVLPYRRQQQQSPPPAAPDPAPGPSAGPWPGLSGGGVSVQTAPPAAPVDLSPVTGALQAIADKMGQQPIVPPVAAPVAPTGPDPQTAAAINQLGAESATHTAQIQSLGAKVDAVPDQINAAVKPVSDKIDKVGKSVEDTNELLAKSGNLRLRFAMAKEAYAEENPDAGRLKQDVGALREMLDSHGTVYKTLAVVAGILFIVGLVHWLRTGHGLVAEAMKKAADRNPEHTKLDDIAAKLMAFEEAARAKLPIPTPASALGGAVGGPVGAAVATASEAALHALQAQITALQSKLTDVAAQTPTTNAATTPAAPAVTVNTTK